MNSCIARSRDSCEATMREQCFMNQVRGGSGACWRACTEVNENAGEEKETTKTEARREMRVGFGVEWNKRMLEVWSGGRSPYINECPGCIFMLSYITSQSLWLEPSRRRPSIVCLTGHWLTTITTARCSMHMQKCNTPRRTQGKREEEHSAKGLLRDYKTNERMQSQMRPVGYTFNVPEVLNVHMNEIYKKSTTNQ